MTVWREENVKGREEDFDLQEEEVDFEEAKENLNEDLAVIRGNTTLKLGIMLNELHIFHMSRCYDYIKGLLSDICIKF